MTIKTNYQPREILYWYDLTVKEQKEFDYISEERQSEATFFRYQGSVYDLGEFMRIEGAASSNVQFREMAKWDGYVSDSYFSGVLVKYTEDFEQVVIATYYS
jgi:hypothetical protein